MTQNPISLLKSFNLQAVNLTQRLELLHDRLVETHPGVDRVACSLYEPGEDLVKTFIGSTRTGQPLVGYSHRLADSESLSRMAASREVRVIDDLDDLPPSEARHAAWLREQGYRSSFTVPIFDGSNLLGFVFFDSSRPRFFGPALQRDLQLYASLIAMAVANELAAVRALLEATRMARELTAVRDFETGAHLERMARYSHVIASVVGPRHGMDDEFVESVYLFASLHDIGKLGIPDKILLKPGRLDPQEREIMETHVVKGLEIVDRIIGTDGDPRLPDSSVLRNIIHCHHEYLDGSGYPRHLRGDQIPLEARIVTVADIFDALTADRPYKKVWGVTEAFGELDAMVRAGKLDAECVQVLRERQDVIQSVMGRFVDAG